MDVEKEIISKICRWYAIIEYEGTQYSGWQLQKEHPMKTIQGQVEAALSKIANQKIKVIASGRTDAGVHAQYQVIHFDSTIVRTSQQWIRGANRYLPTDINLKWVCSIDESFHARYCACSRTYQYFLRPTGSKKGLWDNFILNFPTILQDLNISNMNLAAQYLLGVQDFSAFRSSECQAHSPRRIIFEANVSLKSDIIVITLKANSFLHHMVRNIVGTLLEVGRGTRTLKNFRRLLTDQCHRKFAGKTIAAKGLYLVNVEYPKKYQIFNNFLNIGGSFPFL